jgi:hypothetical protein
MRPVEPGSALAPQPGQALVVFVRPSGFGAAIHPTILDESGRFVGEANARACFGVTVPPGRHRFVVWAENTDALDADVVADKTYFVLVEANLGWGSARMHLYAFTPRHPDWPKREHWLAETRLYTTDFVGGQAYMQTRANEVAERLRRAEENMVGYSPEDRARRTLAVTDGL